MMVAADLEYPWEDGEGGDRLPLSEYIDSFVDAIGNPNLLEMTGLVEEHFFDTLKFLAFDRPDAIDGNSLERSLPFTEAELSWMEELLKKEQPSSFDFDKAVNSRSGVDMVGRYRAWLMNAQGGPYAGQAEAFVRVLRTGLAI